MEDERKIQRTLSQFGILYWAGVFFSFSFFPIEGVIRENLSARASRMCVTLWTMMMVFVLHHNGRSFYRTENTARRHERKMDHMHSR